MPNTEPAIDSRRGRPRRARARRGAPGRRRRRRGDHRRAAGRARSRRSPRWPRSACACSPTTAAGCRTPADAPGARVRRRASASSSPSTARTRSSPRAATCTRAPGRAASGSPASPRSPRRRCSRATSRSCGSTGAPMHFLHLSTAGRSRCVRAGEGRGAPGHRRGDAAPPRPHRRRVACYDPVFKVNPPLRTGRDVPALRDGARRRGHRRDRDRPRARTRRGARTRRSTRPRRACSGSRRRSPWPTTCSASPGAPARTATRARISRSSSSSPCCRGARRRSRARRGPRPRRPDRAGRRAHLCVFDPDRAWTVDPAGRGEPDAGTRPYAGLTAHRAGPPHACSGASPSSSTGGAAVTGTRRPARLGRRLLVLADGAVFEGEAIGALADGAAIGRDGRARLQHRDVGLPGGDHRPVLRRAGDRLHLPAHRQLRRDARGRREPAARSAAASSCATSPSGRATGASTGDLEAFLAHHGVGGLTGVDTRRLTRHVREAGAMPCAFGTAERARAARRGAGRAGHRGRRTSSAR